MARRATRRRRATTSPSSRRATPPAGWVEAQTNRARRIGELQAAGLTWLKYERGAKVQNSLLDRRTGSGELTTLLTGTGTFEELVFVAEHLGPVTLTAARVSR